MLKSLNIVKLFGLYDYELSFSTSPDDKIRFITATNGYGKSTILRIIDSVFTQKLEYLFTVPFSELLFIIDDAVLSVKQIVKNDFDDKIDGKDEYYLEIGIGQDTPETKSIITLEDIRTEGDTYNIVLQQIQMYFSSETCKFIDDRRLLRENTDSSELVRLSEVVKEKMSRSDDTTKLQLDAFREIVERSCFASKSFELNSLFGFRFVSDNENRTKLSMSDLSSGEQHILLITLYMLFEAPEKAIVLIDEPEMSFHLSWQGDYLRNLKQIVALRNVQCIIATHSPFIFSSEYNLTVDLYELTHPIE